jgi:hypothetical protein
LYRFESVWAGATQEHKVTVQKELERIMSSGEVTDFPASLKDYKSFCELIHEALLEQKNEDLRRQVIQTFVHRIEILPDSYRLHYCCHLEVPSLL